MKGLLHSKTFKKNLRKWLFMYVGTLCILTSVITYSKYMSKFNGDSEARPAKFNIKVTYLDKCENVDPDVACSTDLTRPLENYDFYFKVDTTEIEVSSFVVINPRVDTSVVEYADAFKIKGIYEVDEKLKNPKSINNKDSAIGGINYDLSVNDTNRVRYYKVSVAHTIKDEDLAGTANDRMLIVGYSVKQID